MLKSIRPKTINHPTAENTSTKSQQDVSVKISELPLEININPKGEKEFFVLSGNRQVFITLEPKQFTKLVQAKRTWKSWLGVISGKLGDLTENGFILEKPSVEVAENHAPKAINNSTSQSTAKVVKNNPASNPTRIIEQKNAINQKSVASQRNIATQPNIVTQKSIVNQKSFIDQKNLTNQKSISGQQSTINQKNFIDQKNIVTQQASNTASVTGAKVATANVNHSPVNATPASNIPSIAKADQPTNIEINKADKTNKTDKANKQDKTHKADKVDKANKADKVNNLDKPNQSNKPNDSNKPDKNNGLPLSNEDYNTVVNLFDPYLVKGNLPPQEEIEKILSPYQLTQEVKEQILNKLLQRNKLEREVNASIEKAYFKLLDTWQQGFYKLTDKIANDLGLHPVIVRTWINFIHCSDYYLNKVVLPELELQEKIVELYKEYLNAEGLPEKGLHAWIANLLEKKVNKNQVHKVLLNYRLSLRQEFLHRQRLQKEKVNQERLDQQKLNLQEWEKQQAIFFAENQKIASSIEKAYFALIESWDERLVSLIDKIAVKLSLKFATVKYWIKQLYLSTLNSNEIVLPELQLQEKVVELYKKYLNDDGSDGDVLTGLDLYTWVAQSVGEGLTNNQVHQIIVTYRVNLREQYYHRQRTREQLEALPLETSLNDDGK